MPSYSADDTLRKLILAGVALAVVGVTLFFSTRRQEDQTQKVLTDDLTAKVKRSLVLLDEAQLVCLDAASSTLEHRR